MHHKPKNIMDKILKKLSYGHYILTARKPAEEMQTRNQDYLSAGTVSWAMQSSFEPPMITVAVQLNQDLHETIDKSGHFALHILHEDQDKLVKAFGQTSEITPDTINGVPYIIDEKGLPVLQDVVGFIDCKVQETVRSGDHMLIIGQVENGSLNQDVEPLHTAVSEFYYHH